MFRSDAHFQLGSLKIANGNTDLNLRFVEAFYWIVSLKSVTRAAEKLYLTQPAVSSRISALESELGVLLLDRRDKHFRLTLAGERFYAYAERLLDLQREIKSEMGSDSTLTGSLRIGAIESVLHSWLVPWLELLGAEYPGISFELSVDTSPTLIDQAERGTQDLVFAALPVTGESLITRALLPMKMVFVGNRKVHRKRHYSLATLAEVDILTFQRGSQPHVSLLDQMRQAGIKPKRVHTISSISAMAQLVQGGFGVATLPLAAIQNPMSFPNLKPLKCDTELAALPIHASYREDPTSNVVQAVVASAQKFVAENL